MRRTVPAVAATAIAVVAFASPATAHEKAVEPRGSGEGHDRTAISRTWAQAHCHAQAPDRATANSGGVVVFFPAGALPCPAAPNPGGHVHPHAG